MALLLSLRLRRIVGSLVQDSQFLQQALAARQMHYSRSSQIAEEPFGRRGRLGFCTQFGKNAELAGDPVLAFRNVPIGQLEVLEKHCPFGGVFVSPVRSH